MMRQFLRGFSTLGTFILIYMVPIVLVALIHWAVTGTSQPTPNDGLFVLFGIVTMHTLVRRRFNRAEDYPL